ncbi:MAG: hypothetical protein ACMVO5_07425 [Polymorphobacter sp.]|uniref:hypothetical protein n=1 Tax=Polymorphobacter sp. TaxID=1909290 RepID=UPI003A868619
MSWLLVFTMALDMALGELPPQPLAADQCAMALWDKSSQKRIAFWPAASPLLLATTPTPSGLAPEPGSGEGTPVLGLLPRASFSADGLSARLDVEISANPGSKSATIPSGTLTLTTPDGTARIIPVAGIIGCG